MSAKKGSAKWIIGGTVIAVAVVAISLVQLGDNVVYFYTPGEAHAKAAELEGKNIKLGGMVLAGTVKWVPESLTLDFTVSDLKGVEIAVSHKGTPPDMFKEGQGVVVEGLPLLTLPAAASSRWPAATTLPAAHLRAVKQTKQIQKRTTKAAIHSACTQVLKVACSRSHACQCDHEHVGLHGGAVHESTSHALPLPWYL